MLELLLIPHKSMYTCLNPEVKEQWRGVGGRAEGAHLGASVG